jgi:hypothetical protein
MQRERRVQVPGAVLLVLAAPGILKGRKKRIRYQEDGPKREQSADAKFECEVANGICTV